MAASGYDTYGKAIIDNNNIFTNGNIYKKMKNKIVYGKTPEEGIGTEAARVLFRILIKRKENHYERKSMGKYNPGSSGVFAW